MTEPSAPIPSLNHPFIAVFRTGNRISASFFAILFLIAACVQLSARGPFPLPAGVTRLGFLEQPAIAESSGLTRSPNFPGVFWTHNDDGFPAFIFAIDQAGTNLGSFEVKGANLIDFEAISYDDAGFLYLADIGTNGLIRSHSAIHKAIEPDVSRRFGPVQVVKTWYVRFPGEREDCEGFFIHNGFGYLITKLPVNGFVSMYRYELANNDPSIVLEFVTSIPVSDAVGDAAISEDKNRLTLITDNGVYVIFIAGNPLAAGTAYRQFIRYNNGAMEGGTFVPEGVLVALEGIRDLLLFSSPQFNGAPIFTLTLTNQGAFPGGSVEFNVAAIGFPAPTFQWFFNGTLLPGQTGSRLALSNLTLLNAGRYEIVASNQNGSATNSAELFITERTVDVRITEVMSFPATGAVRTADWWELTNFDMNAVDLSGWRFNDVAGGLADAFTIPAGVSIAPGESIIFVENLTPAEFRAWWGAANIPAQTKIITYSGTALSFRVTGDAIRLWDNLATDDVQVYAMESFGQADVGISFNYNPDTDEFPVKSVLGVNGVFRAAAGSDIGSPGLIRAGSVVTPRVNLRITEVLPFASSSLTPTAAWWELSNLGTNLADLSGWRFNDGAGGLPGAFSIPARTRILPGESIIFVQDLTAEQFRAWWGAANIPAQTKIITYPGSAVSFQTTGDSLILWDNLATNGRQVFTSATFGPADQGVSFIYDPVTELFPVKAVLGVHGVFQAASGTDIGSPGLIKGEETPPPPRADLRITEVMSFAATGSGPTADWWELTNFDTNSVDLTGWRFNDSTGGLTDPFAIPSGVSIAPGESVIFVENLTPEEFRTWWGAANIPAQTKIITYAGAALSFSVLGDAIILWDNLATNETQTAASASFGQADAGVSFIYHPVTGEFPIKAVLGAHGVFQAVSGPDIGSPGQIRGEDAPPPRKADLRITEVMSFAATGSAATADWWELTSFDTNVVDLSGWRFNDSTGGLIDAFAVPAGTAISPGESIILVENLTPEEFRAWWGLEKVPAAKKILSYAGAALSFSVNGDQLRLWDNSATQDAQVFTSATFGLADAGVTFNYNPDTGEFPVKSVLGLNGVFQAATGPDIGSPGRIRADPPARIDLRITEAMSFAATGTAATADWWELTSFDPRTINLAGWRFNDGTGGLIDAFAIPTGVSISPGESVIFVENLTPEEFRTWWGPGNFPAQTQIITYTGAALSFSVAGDSIRLWNNIATQDSQVYTNVSFGQADVGVSFNYDPVRNVFPVKSVLGLNGVFRAATGDDIGSPGRIRSGEGSNAGITLTSSRAGGNMQITFNGETGRVYTLEASDEANSTNWAPAAPAVTPITNGQFAFQIPAGPNSKFFRIRGN